MLRIDKNEKKLVRLTPAMLADGELWERQLQDMICADADAFCEEIGERLWVIGKEVRPSDSVSDRIDILAVDDDGKAVVIELKRGTHKLQLMQAVSYAGMVSHWSYDRFIETLARHLHQSSDDARSAIEEHTGSDASSINHAQRILLMAEDFDPALLVAAEWLYEKFDVDIRCYRLQLSQEKGNDYLTCTCIYPPTEIAALTRGRVGANKPSQTAKDWPSWDAALDAVENIDVKEFVRRELAKGQDSRFKNGQIIYRIDGKRRFQLFCRRKYAYVFQRARFEDDIVYWRSHLSQPDHVQPVREGRAVRFRLTTAADIVAFARAMDHELAKMEFSESAELDPSVDTD